MKLLLAVLLCVPFIGARFKRSLAEDTCTVDYLKTRGFPLNDFVSSEKLSDDECKTLVDLKKTQNHEKVLERIRSDEKLKVEEECILGRMVKLDFYEVLLLENVYQGQGFGEIDWREAKLKTVQETISESLKNFLNTCSTTSKRFGDAFDSLLTAPDRGGADEKDYCLRMQINKEKLLTAFSVNLEENPKNINVTNVDCKYQMNHLKDELILASMHTIFPDENDDKKLNCAKNAMVENNFATEILQFGVMQELLRLNLLSPRIKNRMRKQFIEIMTRTQRNVISKCF